MNTNFEIEVKKPNVGTNGSNMSLRDLVDKNQKAMHGMSSRFGDVNTLKNLLEELLGILANQKEILGQEIKVLSKNDKDIKDSLEVELGKLRKSVIIDQKNTDTVNESVKKEIEEVQRLEKKFDEQLAKVEVVVSKRFSRQRYLWCGVGVLVLSLVVCLGYLCNELREVTKEVKKLQANVDVSMTEVKGAVLIKEMEKASQEKAVMASKGKKH